MAARMYVAAQIAAVVLYLLLTAAGALFARRRGGSWRAFIRGAITVTVASTLGGIVGGLLFGNAVGVVYHVILHQTSPVWIQVVNAIFGGAVGGACEEVARIFGIRSGRDRLSYGFG